MKKTLIALMAILAATQITNAANRGANWISVPMLAHYATYNDYLNAEYKRNACPQKNWAEFTTKEKTSLCKDVHENDQNGSLKKIYFNKIKKDDADGTTNAYYKAFPKLKRPPTPTE